MKGANTLMDIDEKIEFFKSTFNNITKEIKEIIVGNEKIIWDVLVAILSGGNVLLEGVPGLGKTMLVRTLSEVMDMEFARIQFTPDLMPSDIIGTNIILEDERGTRYFNFQKGPVFANIILADEINRATPKTQSALLEAMQEHSVTIAGQIRKLKEPFFELATQNPLEMEGTYPLPEAQLDRFMFKLKIDFPSIEDLGEIISRTTSGIPIDVKKVANAEKIIQMQQIVPLVKMSSLIKDYILRLVLATHPDKKFATDMARQYVRYGASPRAAQAIVLASKVCALMDNRFNVSFEDVRSNVLISLRHRLILNFEGKAEGMTSDAIIEDILEKIEKK